MNPTTLDKTPRPIDATARSEARKALHAYLSAQNTAQRLLDEHHAARAAQGEASKALQELLRDLGVYGRAVTIGEFVVETDARDPMRITKAVEL